MINLEKVLSIQTYSGKEWRMFAFIVRECKRLGADVRQDNQGNLYVTKGVSRTYPCIVAHMDSVHKIGEDLSIIEHNGVMTGFNYATMQQSGIGGDDKVGIYIGLRCLEYYDAIKLAFFVDEERGCIGSGGADMSFFDDCRFVLQADRRGNTDFVVNASGTKLSSKKFKKAVRPLISDYGYSFSDGMMTDVMQLKQNGLKVSCANISCGYYRPHAVDEYVVVDHVENCLDMFITLIDNMEDVYEHTYSPPSYYGRYSWDDRSFDSYKAYTPKTYTPSTYKPKYDAYWDDLDTASSWRKKEDEVSYYCDNCNELHVTTDLTYNKDYNAFMCEGCNAAFA
jgi:putative aminopeptidase FrvX